VGVLDGWKLCPRCGGELEARERGHLACPGCGASYWANSSPAAQGVLERDGRVLLAKRRHEPRKGYWDLPSGFLEEGEEPLAGLRRELREETGLELSVAEWAGASIDRYEHQFVLSLSWIVQADGEPVAADDVEELAWFRPDELPGEMAFDSQGPLLREWAARAARA